MKRMFREFKFAGLTSVNRFIFPPIKLGYGSPDGSVTDRQLNFYKRIAKNGPGLIILEPVAVTAEGREHPKQPCVHLSSSSGELKKIADIIHEQGRLACLHLNHAGAAANPKLIGGSPKAPSVMTCIAREGNTSVALTKEEIAIILLGYRSAAKKAQEAGFDVIEIQGGHGYLISQFLNSKINKREDQFGQDRLLFAKKVFTSVKEGGPGVPCILRISGNEMSPEFGISRKDLLPLFALAKESGICAIHVGMGNACFSPPWYFHHGSLPTTPQRDALVWVREQTSLPIIVAGRMGRRERVQEIMDNKLADLVALGRPLLADPDLIEKWQKELNNEIMHCGYCLQGCLHRLKGGKPLGCNFNPEIGLPPLEPVTHPKKVLIAGGGPAGMSAAQYMARRGHKVTLAERRETLGGQLALAWQVPGKEILKDSLESLVLCVRQSGAIILLNRSVDPDLLREVKPDLLVWACGAVQNIAEIPGLESQHVLTSLEYFRGEKEVRGNRVLVIGAGRIGVEIAAKLGGEDYEVVATKRTDPIGGTMDMISKKLILMKIDQMPKVTLMSHASVLGFSANSVDLEQNGQQLSKPPFDTVILSSGMLSAPGPDEEIANMVPVIDAIGDAQAVKDIFSAVKAGYELALRHQ